mmetsp:Transcript_15156/g.42449  ORF Transcript_15156/g.42449 Transcript_15156/m.42449 type:complete len:300 (-) Transcript_15156:88-987(-)
MVYRTMRLAKPLPCKGIRCCDYCLVVHGNPKLRHLLDAQRSVAVVLPHDVHKDLKSPPCRLVVDGTSGIRTGSGQHPGAALGALRRLHPQVPHHPQSSGLVPTSLPQHILVKILLEVAASSLWQDWFLFMSAKLLRRGRAAASVCHDILNQLSRPDRVPFSLPEDILHQLYRGRVVRQLLSANGEQNVGDEAIVCLKRSMNIWRGAWDGRHRWSTWPRAVCRGVRSRLSRHNGYHVTCSRRMLRTIVCDFTQDRGHLRCSPRGRSAARPRRRRDLCGGRAPGGSPGSHCTHAISTNVSN